MTTEHRTYDYRHNVKSQICKKRDLMGLASHFTDWRVDLLVHHCGTHLVAERSDAFQLDGAAVLHPQRHNLGQRQQYRIYTQGRRRGRIDDILALFIGRHRLSLRHGSDTPFLLALPFAFDILDKSRNINILVIGLKGLVPMPVVEVSTRHRQGLNSTPSSRDLDKRHSHTIIVHPAIYPRILIFFPRPHPHCCR